MSSPSTPPDVSEYNYDFDTFEREGDFEGGSEYKDTHDGRLKSKMIEAPFVPIGRCLLMFTLYVCYLLLL